MFLRPLLGFSLCVASAEAFAHAPLPPLRKSAARSGTCAPLRMVDWSEPKKEFKNWGTDLDQENKSDDIEADMLKRTAEARKRDTEAGSSSRSEYGHGLAEGSRDPRSGRLVIDPLKIPTTDQGAPASFAEYMDRRASKNASTGKHGAGKSMVTDIGGNDVTGVRPSAPVHQGSWGAPKAVETDVFGQPMKKVEANALTEEQKEWNAKKAQEKSDQAKETEARMAKWMADAAAKKAEK